MSRVAVIFGVTGTGKTTLALGLPGKKWIGEWDIGSFERARKPAGVEVHLEQFLPPKDAFLNKGKLDISKLGASQKGSVRILDTTDGWEDAYMAAKMAYAQACEDNYSDLIIDTSTLLKEWVENQFREQLRDAKVDRDIQQMEYAEIHKQMELWRTRAKIGNKNLIWITHESEFEGVVKPQGWNRILNGADYALRLTVEGSHCVATFVKKGGGGLAVPDGNLRLVDPTLPKVIEILDASKALLDLGISTFQMTSEEILDKAARQNPDVILAMAVLESKHVPFDDMSAGDILEAAGKMS